MRIGTCVRYDEISTDIESKFRFLKNNGISSCQLISWCPSIWTDDNAILIKECIKKYDITISAFWCGWEGPKVWNFYEGQKTLGLIPPEYREMRIKNLCDGADFAKKLELTDVVSHMGFIPENPYDPNFYDFCDSVRIVAQHCKKNGQYLLFETGQETPVAMLRCFETVGLDNLGVNLDTANLILYGKGNPVDALDVLGRYVRNLHAKDGFYPTNGKELGKEVELGTGKVDFKSLFKKLKELGYNSYVTIEREIGGDNDPGVISTYKYLEKIINEVYGE